MKIPPTPHVRSLTGLTTSPDTNSVGLIVRFFTCLVVTLVCINSTWAASDRFERLCVSANDTAPIFVFRDGNGTVERMDIELFDPVTGLVDVTPNGRGKAIRAKYTKLNKAEIDEVCATTGISVAVLPKQNGIKMAEGFDASNASDSAKALKNILEANLGIF